MIDIHSHVLAGVDDGPKNLVDSLQIVEQAVYAGVRIMVATPHVFDKPSDKFLRRVSDALQDLRKRVVKSMLPIEIILGAEVFLSPDVPEMIREHPSLSINGARKYVLIEFPMNEIPSYTEDVFFELLMDGIQPIIAHPERYYEIFQTPEKLIALIQKGALTQLNSGSLKGKYGKRTRENARRLLAHNCIHILGSDAHSCRTGYLLKEGRQMVEEIVGSESALEMTETLPEQIVNGRCIEISSPRTFHRGFLHRFFSFN